MAKGHIHNINNTACCPKKSYIMIGLLFIVIGVVCNKWVLERLFSPDSAIITFSYIAAIYFFETVCITLGILFLMQKREILIKLSLLLGAVLVLLTFIECYLRLTKSDNNLFEWSYVYRKAMDGTGLYELKPNLNLSVKRGANYISMKTNSLCMRWREVSYDNPLKKTRIAFMGDSFTLGCWADSTENSFVGVCDKLIDKNRYEILNFGTASQGWEEAKILIQHKVLRFHPAFIVMNIFTGNDFRDTYLGADKVKLINGVMDWNMTVLESKIPAQYRDNSNDHQVALFSFLDKFYSYQLLVKAKNIMEQNFLFRFFNMAPRIEKYSFTSMTFMCQDPYPEIAKEAVRISLKELDNIKKICDDNNITLIVTALPTREQIYSSKLVGKGYNLNLPQQYVAEFCQKNSIPYLDLLPVLRGWVRENKKNVFYYNDIHYSNTGHRVVGEAIAEYFKGLRIIDRLRRTHDNG